MRFITTYIHGILDYLVGALLIAAPFLLGFDTGGPAMWTPILVGASVIAYSLVTDYELGLAPLIPMPVHLMFDMLGGVILAASPWLLGFDQIVWVPHVAVGALEIAAALMTHPVPARDVTPVRV